MAPTTGEAKKKIQRLKEAVITANQVVNDPNRNFFQVSTSIQILERGMERVAAFSEFVKDDKDQPFDYHGLSYEAMEDAEDALIYLRAHAHDFEKADQKAIKDAKPVQTAPIVQGQRSIRSAIKVTIPIFRGECEKYPSFKSAFLTAIEGENLTKKMQLRVLEQHLQDRPLQLIENIRPSDEGFDEAMKMLDDAYDVKERQKDALKAKLKRIPRAKDDLITTRDNYEKIESILRGLKEYMDIDENEELRKLVMSKFSDLTLDRISPDAIPTLQCVRNWLKCIIRSKEDQASIFTDLSTLEKPTLIPVAALVANGNAKPSTPTPKSDPAATPKTGGTYCRFCLKDNHRSVKCRTYPTAKQRAKELPMGTCFKCLRKEHDSKDCRHSEKCRFCESTNHHPSLCPKEFRFIDDRAKDRYTKNGPIKKAEEVAKVEPTKDVETVKTIVHMARCQGCCFLTAMCTLRNPVTKAAISGRLFKDCGADVSFILHRTSEYLELVPIDKVHLIVGVFMGSAVQEALSYTVQVELLDPTTGEAHLLDVQTVPSITEGVRTHTAAEMMKKYPQLREFNLVDEANEEEVVILLGNDYLWRFILPETKIQLNSNLYALATTFGWMIVGNERNVTTTAPAVYHASTKSIQTIWSLDSIGIKDKSLSQSEEEQLALEQFNRTIRYVPEEKRYEVGLPCRTLRPEIPTNFAVAKAILFSLLRRNRSNTDYLRICNEIFDTQVQEGIIERVENPKTVECHYLPYKWVERPGKSTPIRIVYNASNKTAKGTSLNDTLYRGVNLIGDMIGILIRFRLHTVAVVTDVAKAFHQITITPEFRDYLRFLWSSNPADPENFFSFFILTHILTFSCGNNK